MTVLSSLSLLINQAQKLQNIDDKNSRYWELIQASSLSRKLPPEGNFSGVSNHPSDVTKTRDIRMIRHEAPQIAKFFQQRLVTTYIKIMAYQSELNWLRTLTFSVAEHAEPKRRFF